MRVDEVKVGDTFVFQDEYTHLKVIQWEPDSIIFQCNDSDAFVTNDNWFKAVQLLEQSRKIEREEYDMAMDSLYLSGVIEGMRATVADEDIESVVADILQGASDE